MHGRAIHLLHAANTAELVLEKQSEHADELFQGLESSRLHSLYQDVVVFTAHTGSLADTWAVIYMRTLNCAYPRRMMFCV